MNLVKYSFAHVFDSHEGEEDTSVKVNHIYEYVVANNGVFVKADKEDLSVCFIHSWLDGVRGLKDLYPYFTLRQKVPPAAFYPLLRHAWNNRIGERLYYGLLKDYKWHFVVPKQAFTQSSVKPVDPFNVAGTDSLIEVHTHSGMPAVFSLDDNTDEVGFKIYTVLGKMDTLFPEIRTRVGIYGMFFEIPSEWVYSGLPYQFVDKVAEKHAKD